MAADEEAPQRLLQVIRESVPDKNTIQTDDKKEPKKYLQKQKEEEREFGVFYDDEYNYMQHLKDREMPEYDYSEMDKFLLETPKNLIDSEQQGQGKFLHRSKKPTAKVGTILSNGCLAQKN